MSFKWKYKTPEQFDDLMMISDGENLTALFFINSCYPYKVKEDLQIKNLPIFDNTCKWLDEYFSGSLPNFTPKIKINNSTKFRKKVSDIMAQIPYGKTITYSDIACKIARETTINKMSSQAVGGAVGFNPISLIIPCHRVVGKNGSLTGYGGGIKNKYYLLKHENNDMSKFFIPKMRTYL